jgi:hypothetical protein
MKHRSIYEDLSGLDDLDDILGPEGFFGDVAKFAKGAVKTVGKGVSGAVKGVAGAAKYVAKSPVTKVVFPVHALATSKLASTAGKMVPIPVLQQALSAQDQAFKLINQASKSGLKGVTLKGAAGLAGQASGALGAAGVKMPSVRVPSNIQIPSVKLPGAKLASGVFSSAAKKVATNQVPKTSGVTVTEPKTSASKVMSVRSAGAAAAPVATMQVTPLDTQRLVDAIGQSVGVQLQQLAQTLAARR